MIFWKGGTHLKRFLPNKLSLRHPSKEQITLEKPQNDYYENVSAALGITQVILYLSLLAFVVLSFLSNTNLITYQNFYYFLKDLNASAETVDVFYTDSINYPMDEEQSFSLYRKGLAVAGNRNVTVFTATGRQTISQTIQYQNPVSVGSGRYLLVYELGGKQYSVYNSYARVFSGTSEYPIRGAAVSDSGMYALITSSSDYVSVVSLYNDRFSLINRYNKKDYVTDVAINSNGSLIGILTSSAQNGTFSTEVMICEPGSTQARAQVKIGTALGLKCSFSTDTTLAVLSGEDITFLSQNGKMLATRSFDGMPIICADIGTEGVCVCLKNAGSIAEDVAWIFDVNGKLLRQFALPDRVSQVAKCGNLVYLMTADGIRCLDTKGNRDFLISCVTEKKVLLAVSEKEVLLCSPQKADYIRTEESS